LIEFGLEAPIVEVAARQGIFEQRKGNGMVGGVGPGEMDTIEHPEGSPADKKRLAARVAVTWFLQNLANARALGGGDILDGLIMLSIVEANTSHLNEPQYGFKCMGDIPPDDVRQPVSVYQVARELGLSYETTRRHVQHLIQAGKVERKAEGIIVPASLFAEPENLNLTNTAYRNLMEFAEQLKDLEII